MNRIEAIAQVKGYTAFELSSGSLGGCFSPDSLTSPGAVFLASVRDDLIEAVEYGRFGDDSTEDRGDVLSELTNEAPDTYTHTMWTEFVDLGAYREDIETEPSNMEGAAREALTTIGRRLSEALLTEIEDADEEDADEEDADEEDTDEEE